MRGPSQAGDERAAFPKPPSGTFGSAAVEQLRLRKIGLWVLVLLVCLGLIGMVGFGAAAADFVNRAENGRVYHLGWTRFVAKKLGDRVVAKMKLENCNG